MRHAPLALALILALAPGLVMAAPARPQDQTDEQIEAARTAREQEFGTNYGALPALRNVGPCPYVKVLYDAARFIEFKDNQESAAQVVYSGEIDGVSAECAYRGTDPITISFNMLMSFGKGPQATAPAKTYRYWVAVTDRNRSVLAKQYFDLPVRFEPGEDRARLNEWVRGISIPRANAEVSGDNFEVLIGFDVTPAMAAFNREGKRFLPPGAQASAPAQ